MKAPSAVFRQELDIVYSGDIAAAVGFKFTTTGDTICDEQHPVILESMEFPEPVIELAIEPKTKAGQGKMGEALAKLAEEDPTFRDELAPALDITISLMAKRSRICSLMYSNWIYSHSTVVVGLYDDGGHVMVA